MSSWTGYMMLSNGWTEPITEVNLTHRADSKDPNTITKDRLGVGETTQPMQFTAYSDHHDNWSVSFKTSDNAVHGASLKNEGFKEEDENGILFAQVTKENNRFTLYFPVSSDAHTTIV